MRADFLVTNLHNVFIARVTRHRLRPHVEELLGACIERLCFAVDKRIDTRRHRLLTFTEHAARSNQLLAFAGKTRLLVCPCVIIAHSLGDLRKIAHTSSGYDGLRLRRCMRGNASELARCEPQSTIGFSN